MKKKKVYFIFTIIVVLIIVLLLLISTFSVKKTFRYNKKQEKKSLKIGLLLYRYDDTFIDNVRRSIDEYVRDYEKINNIKINLDIVDAQNNYINQNKQAARFISLGYDVLIINPVDRTNVSNIIDSAIYNNIPIVFFNRQPVDDDLYRDKNIFYVGVDAKTSAVLQGNMIVDLYKKDPDILDVNKDGYIDYILLEGEKSHQDSLIRTEWSIKTIQDANVPIRKLDGVIANWERSQAGAIYESLIKKYKNIELVISNNDDMALGAIDAIERYNGNNIKIKTPIIVGIDGIPEAIEEINEGYLYGTVLSDRSDYAKKIVDIAVASVMKNNDEEYNKKIYDVNQECIIRESK